MNSRILWLVAATFLCTLPASAAWQRVDNSGFTSLESANAENLGGIMFEGHPSVNLSNPINAHTEVAPWRVASVLEGQDLEIRLDNGPGVAEFVASGFDPDYCAGPDGIFTNGDDPPACAWTLDPTYLAQAFSSWESIRASEINGTLRTPLCNASGGLDADWSQNFHPLVLGSARTIAAEMVTAYTNSAVNNDTTTRDFRGEGLGTRGQQTEGWDAPIIFYDIDEPGSDAVQVTVTTAGSPAGSILHSEAGRDRHLHVEVYSCDGKASNERAEVLYVEDFYTGDGSPFDLTACGGALGANPGKQSACTFTVKKQTPSDSDVTGIGVWSVDGGFTGIRKLSVGQSSQTVFLAKEDHSNPYRTGMTEFTLDFQMGSEPACIDIGCPTCIGCYIDSAHRVCNGGTIYANHCGDGATARHPNFPLAAKEAWSCRDHTNPALCGQVDSDNDGFVNWIDGDFNQDNFVNALDYDDNDPTDGADTFLECFTHTLPQPASCWPMDMDASGTTDPNVNATDFSRFLIYFNKGINDAVELDGMSEAGLAYPY